MTTATKTDDFCSHGVAYPPDDCPGTVRPSACETCAFKVAGATVRPPEVSLAALIEVTSEYDDFYCHHRTERGFETCAAWHAHHRKP